MGIRTPGMAKNYVATAAIEKYRIVKFAATFGQVTKGAAATDLLMGVSSDVDTGATERCDVYRTGIAPVIYGGNVAAGDLLTSDSDGRAIATTTANNRYIGIAEEPGVLGDLGSVMICPGIV
jgi:hypothetical protein